MFACQFNSDHLSPVCLKLSLELLRLARHEVSKVTPLGVKTDFCPSHFLYQSRHCMTPSSAGHVTSPIATPPTSLRVKLVQAIHLPPPLIWSSFPAAATLTPDIVFSFLSCFSCCHQTQIFSISTFNCKDRKLRGTVCSCFAQSQCKR